MYLNDYTKKIIRRLAIAFGIAGLVSLVGGAYAYEIPFIVIGIGLLLSAQMGYEIGSSENS